MNLLIGFLQALFGILRCDAIFIRKRLANDEMWLHLVPILYSFLGATNRANNKYIKYLQVQLLFICLEKKIAPCVKRFVYFLATVRVETDKIKFFFFIYIVLT